MGADSVSAVEGVSADTDAVRRELRGERMSDLVDGNSPWTCTMAKTSFALVVQFISNMSQACTPFNGCDAGCVVENHPIHAVHLDSQVAVLSTQSKGSVAMSATFCVCLDAQLSCTSNGILNMFRCFRYCNGDGSVVEAQVERRTVELPVIRSMRIERHAGLG